MAAATNAHAEVILELGDYVTGATPSGTSPWLTLTFTDAANPDEVELLIQANLQSASEFVSDLVFNGPASVNFQRIDGAGDFADPAISGSADGVSLAPLAGFDYGLAFATSNKGGGSLRFNGTDSLTYLLTCNGCDETDFAVATSASWYAAMHVQGIAGPVGSGKWGDSTYEEEVSLDDPEEGGSFAPHDTPVPEPASLLLMGAAGAGLAARLRRRARRSRQ